MFKKEVGKKGEELAIKYLLGKGYKLIAKNVYYDFGELDSIFIDKDVYVFVEVRARLNEDESLPEDSIDRWKISRVEELAEFYIHMNNITNQCRIDAVCILFRNDFKIISLKHYKDISQNYI